MSNPKRISLSLTLEQKVDLSNHNFISKNTVFISNIPEKLYSKDILYQKKFLGQYGHISQILFDKYQKKEKNIIVQFDTVNQAALCILSLENFLLDNGVLLSAKYFITKFCNYFLNNKECPNQNCLYLHNILINDYLYLKIICPKMLDSFQFALNLLNIPKNIFALIKTKLIGENYYEKERKFPKLTIKKLKNQQLIKNLNPIVKKVKLKENYSKFSSEDDSVNTNDSRNKSNSSFKKIRRKNSRFDFVKNENLNVNCNFSVVIPEFVLDFLDKSSNNFFQMDNINQINNYHDNWYNILFGNNTCKQYLIDSN